MSPKDGNCHSKGCVVRDFSAIWRDVSEMMASLKEISVTSRFFFSPEMFVFFNSYLWSPIDKQYSINKSITITLSLFVRDETFDNQAVVMHIYSVTLNVNSLALWPGCCHTGPWTACYEKLLSPIVPMLSVFFLPLPPTWLFACIMHQTRRCSQKFEKRA